MMAGYGANLISLAALLGAAVSIYNYFDPMSGIAGTPGAILAIAASIILFLLGIVLGTTHSPSLRWFAAASLLLGIAGTAFAAYLLNSQVLLGLMAACALGWLIALFEPSRSLA